MIIRGAETTSLHLLLQRSEDLLYRIWYYFCQFQYSQIQTTLIMIVKLVNQYWISIKLSWGDICRGNETIYYYVLLCITCRYSCKWWLAGGTLQDGLLGSVFQVIWYWQRNSRLRELWFAELNIEWCCLDVESWERWCEVRTVRAGGLSVGHTNDHLHSISEL